MRWILTTFILLAFATPAVANAPSIPTGSWAYQASKAEKAKMEAMVDSVVDDMSFVIRPIARPRLKKEAAPWTKVVISRDGDKVTVTKDDRTFTSVLGQKKKLKDDVYALRRVDGARLIESIDGKDGGRTNVFELTPKGLRVDSKIRSPKLPRPLEFSYTYR